MSNLKSPRIREAPVRFGSVTGSGFRYRRFLCKKGFFCVSVQFNKKGRFRFRFLENGSGGSGSAFGFGKNGSGGSGFRFRFGSWATLYNWVGMEESAQVRPPKGRKEEMKCQWKSKKKNISLNPDLAN